YQGDLYKQAKECDALVIMTAHKDYFSLDMAKLRGSMRTPLIVDGRNVILENNVEGFTLIQLGRGSII
ncbi:MAG: UDP-glucose 6-dehydrogenase, partial [Chloroflexi bacterium]|nr:UDP-glucose 6-dehydrogenase [Chloroflexota bacterium]